MINKLKTIILDFQNSQLDTGIDRLIPIEAIPGKATVLIGVRRSGKSTYLFQIVKKLLKRGVPKENILYINFFDDRFSDLKNNSLDVILEAYYSLYPDKKYSETVYYFFDEIQVIPNWESFVDRLLRTEKCEIYLTGSSAQMLSKEIATQMRGRALSWEIFPFSFREFLNCRKINLQSPAPNIGISTKDRLLIQNAFEEYWQMGGFPETVSLNEGLKIKVHQEYFHTILFRDLVERHNISHPKAILDLGHWLMDNIASLYSVNRLTNYLKSLGHNAPKYAVSDYLRWFEDAYFLFSLQIYDPSVNRRNANPKKIYCVDHAFVNSVSSGILVNSGHILENLVFVALRFKNDCIFYYRTKTGKEVDFIALNRGQPKILVQVSEKMVDPRTKKREIAALGEAMTELKLEYGTIVTYNEEERLIVDAGIIDIVPAWKFLLINDHYFTTVHY